MTEKVAKFSKGERVRVLPADDLGTYFGVVTGLWAEPSIPREEQAYSVQLDGETGAAVFLERELEKV